MVDTFDTALDILVIKQVCSPCAECRDMGLYVCKEVVCHIIGNILAIFIDYVGRQLADWNELPMDQRVSIGYLALLGIVNHDITDFDGITLNPVQVRLMLRNHNLEHLGGIFPGCAHRKEVAVQRGFVDSNELILYILRQILVKDGSFGRIIVQEIRSRGYRVNDGFPGILNQLCARFVIFAKSVSTCWTSSGSASAGAIGSGYTFSSNTVSAKSTLHIQS